MQSTLPSSTFPGVLLLLVWLPPQESLLQRCSPVHVHKHIFTQQTHVALH
jgi:hypothetical protein